MNVYQKIKQAREILGQTQSEFARNVGATQKDVSKIELEAKKFIPNKYIEYLISENFDINTLFNSTLDLSKNYPKDIVQEAASIYKNKTDINLTKQQIPLYQVEAIAGVTPIFTDLNQQEPYDYLHIPNAPKCDGAIYATGDSMYPLIKSGDIIAYKIITDLQNDIYWGQMYILYIEIAGDLFRTVKYVKKGNLEDTILLVSVNKHHEDKEVKLSKVKAMAQVKLSIRIN
jgi:phage repressor protein C with HTH and peptisase S24 domain